MTQLNSIQPQECKQFTQQTCSEWAIGNSKGKAWVVCLDGIPIDIVWFKEDCTKDYIKKVLLTQDGYDSGITLQRPM